MLVELDDFLKLNLKDEVFVIETDTVYGIGCLMSSKIGAERIMSIKHRTGDKHFSLLVSNLDQVKELSTNYNDSMDLIIKHWPGALTIIFNKTDKVKDFVSSDDTVGLRMPNNERTLKILDKFGPMIMTSLNETGEPPIVKFDDAIKYEDLVDYIVKGNDCVSIPSTVYNSITKKILRQGSVII